MGDCVGKLFFGALLTSDGAINYYKGGGIRDGYRKFFDSGNKEVNKVTRYEQPYETEEHYLIIVESNKVTYNEGMLIGSSIETKPEWEQLLKDRAKEAGVEISEIGWHLVGHYN